MIMFVQFLLGACDMPFVGHASQGEQPCLQIGSFKQRLERINKKLLEIEETLKDIAEQLAQIKSKLEEIAAQLEQLQARLSEAAQPVPKKIRLSFPQLQSYPGNPIAPGALHSLVVARGDLYSFGEVQDFRPGHGSTRQMSPEMIEFPSKKPVKMIAAGATHSLVLAGGDLFSFGNGSFGQLGHNGCKNQLLPKEIEAFRGKHIEMIAAGGYCSCVVADGELFGFGGGENRRLGRNDDQESPQKIEFFDGMHIDMIAIGQGHTLVVADGDLFGFGLGANGQLGDGDIQTHLMPKKNDFFRKNCIRMIAAGAMHSLVVEGDNLYSFGCGDDGQLGHNCIKDEYVPRIVKFFSNKYINAIAAGTAHSLVVADGELYSFGWGAAGKLGHGDKNNQQFPKKVEAFGNMRIDAIAAGDFHSLVVTNGGLYSFGTGLYGMLGHGDKQNQLVPKKVEAFDGKRIVPLERPYWWPTDEDLLNSEERYAARGNINFVASLLWKNCPWVNLGVDDMFVDVLTFFPE